MVEPVAAAAASSSVPAYAVPNYNMGVPGQKQPSNSNKVGAPAYKPSPPSFQAPAPGVAPAAATSATPAPSSVPLKKGRKKAE